MKGSAAAEHAIGQFFKTPQFFICKNEFKFDADGHTDRYTY